MSLLTPGDDRGYRQATVAPGITRVLGLGPRCSSQALTCPLEAAPLSPPELG